MTLPSSANRLVTVTVDGQPVRAREGSVLLDVLASLEIETPTLCYLETLTPASACRVCVVEVEGSRALVPACAWRVGGDVAVHTDSEGVRHSRRMVLELLASSVDLSRAGPEVGEWMERYGAEPARYGLHAARVERPVADDNDLYVRDYDRCILCYKCVEACGVDAQNTFAISVAGRGFDARISTEFALPLPESACVFCGNCIGVCPTGALAGRTEWMMRREGAWNEARQAVTRTICAYCGVGCNLDLTVQDNRIVRVTSPLDHDVTSGHLCIKGRFGYEFVHEGADRPGRAPPVG